MGISIDFAEILNSLPSLRGDGIRIGYPDVPAPVSLSDRDNLIGVLDGAICSFRELRGGTTVVDANDNFFRKSVVMRITQRAKGESRNGVVEPEISEPMSKLKHVLESEEGHLDYWGGNNYFDVEVPLADLSSLREYSIDTEGLSWNETYQAQLARVSWESLRHDAYRNCNLAAAIAAHFDSATHPTVYIPSVGICSHPWLFASRGFGVIASDVSSAALSAVRQPYRLPLIYSLAGYERWDISRTCAYSCNSSRPQPDYFSDMPDLGSLERCASLARRIEFLCCDWADVSIPNGSIDLIFASNALPRTSDEELERVVAEWVRVLSADGHIFVAQHNPSQDMHVDSLFQDHGLVLCSILSGDLPPAQRGYQLYFSSG